MKACHSKGMIDRNTQHSVWLPVSQQVLLTELNFKSRKILQYLTSHRKKNVLRGMRKRETVFTFFLFLSISLCVRRTQCITVMNESFTKTGVTEWLLPGTEIQNFVSITMLVMETKKQVLFIAALLAFCSLLFLSDILPILSCRCCH